jgi:soluble lytic murein transglycosylase
VGTDTLKLDRDALYVLAARYWHARWQIYPDVAAPTIVTADPNALETGIRELLDLAEAFPGHYYGLLAAARLQALAPQRLAAIPAPGWHADPGGWHLSEAFVASPAVLRGVALSRLGLLEPAQAEWRVVEPELLDAAAQGFIAGQVEAAGDFNTAHTQRRALLKRVPAASWGENRRALLLAAYPDRWRAEVEAAAKGDRYDWRLFYGLVREESGYNPKAKSHAGARGLSQLMPATGRSVATWLGMKITTAQLYDVGTNLKIGARYLDALHKKFGDDPFACLAAYNAGEGNVGKWLKASGNLPIDEFVERIPFRETRKYVKAVSGSWQIYRLLDETTQEVFPPLSAFNHAVVPPAETARD